MSIETDPPSQRPSPTPTFSLAPSPALSLTPRPTSTDEATPAPTPTHNRLELDFSDLTYSPTACWSSRWFDGEGHQVGGMPVRFAITIKNRDDVRSGYIWITLQSTRVAVRPTPLRDNWSGDDEWGDDATLVIAAPPIGPGKSVKYRWRVLLATPFDAYYSLKFSTGPDPTHGYEPSLLRDVADFGEMWTASAIC